MKNINTALADEIVALYKKGRLPTPFTVNDIRKHFRGRFSDKHIKTVLANYCKDTGDQVKKGRLARFRRISRGKYISV